MIVGLTGGIASGKSTVCGMLRECGALIIDADRIAREVVACGRPAWKEVRAAFGTHILQPDGNLDRTALGKVVFEDATLRRRLEAIIHPHVRRHITEETLRAVRCAPQAVVVQDIPLLLETGMTDGLEEVIVVYVPQPIQLQRLMARDRLGEEQARLRIAAQMPLEEKRRQATIVIDNSADLEQTRSQVQRVYSQLARRACRSRQGPPGTNS